MGLFPGFNALSTAHVLALVDLGMAAVTEGCYAVVMALDPAAFAVPELVGVRGYDGAILHAAALARAASDGLQQLGVSVHHGFFNGWV